MANKYLNDTGLQYFYNKLKTVFQQQESGKGLSTNDYTTDEKTKLSGIATGAEVNQKAFSNVKVGSTTVAADSKTDTLTLEAGSNVTLTPDATNNKVTIAAKDTVTTATTSGSGNAVTSVTASNGALTVTKGETFLTSADIADKADKSATVSNVEYDATNKKLTKTIDGTTSDVVAVSTLKTDMALSKSDVGLGNVDNTADANKSVSSAATLTTERNIEGVKFNGSANVSHYATCETLGGTAAKVATITPSTTKFALVTGARVFVKFSQWAPGASSPTLNVNGTGAKQMRYADNTIGTLFYPKPKRVYEFIYDGSYWLAVGDFDTDTHYNNMTQEEATAGTVTAARTISPKVLSTTIANAVAGVTQISYQVVETLPETGSNGVIYLVAHSHGTGDGYDEYIWLGTSYEKLGNTDIDLSNYLKKTDMVAITTSEIDTLFA